MPMLPFTTPGQKQALSEYYSHKLLIALYGKESWMNFVIEVAVSVLMEKRFCTECSTARLSQRFYKDYTIH